MLALTRKDIDAAAAEWVRGQLGLTDQAAAPLSPLAWAKANARIVTPSQGVAPWEPYDYQERLLGDHSPRRLVLKARQTGLSTAIALEALYYATHLEHDRTLFVSRNQELAGLLIRYVQVAIAGMPLVRTVAESQSKVVFANGSEIVSLPANPATGRGALDAQGPQQLVLQTLAGIRGRLVVAAHGPLVGLPALHPRVGRRAAPEHVPPGVR